MPKAHQSKPICSECGRINKNPLNAYGRVITRHLSKRGEDAAALAKNMRVTKGAIHGIMHEHKMSIHQLGRIATALEVPMSTLVKEVEKENAGH